MPGIDFTNDPLLQARLFSYLDTQLIRLGGPSFPQIPINRPVAEVCNHHRDGYHQLTSSPRLKPGDSSPRGLDLPASRAIAVPVKARDGEPPNGLT
ncbi:catalase [Streptosporangium canum]|uniref:catalase n=1 Tax=Streptosporangium canum TaxID=324952 RepID=UPI0036D189B9